MADELTLPERLQAQLDEFFTDQWQQKTLRIWLENSIFSHFYENNEKMVRAGFAEAIEQYRRDVSRLNTSNLQEEVRVGALALNDQKLQMYFDTYKEMAERHAEILVKSFQERLGL